MDLKISDYFKYVDYARNKLPVFARNYIYDIVFLEVEHNGNIKNNA